MKRGLWLILWAWMRGTLWAQCAIPFVENHRWGLIHPETAETLCLPKYEYLKPMNNLWVYRHGTKYGVLSPNLDTLSIPKFSVIYMLNDTACLAYFNSAYTLYFWQDSTKNLIFEVDTILQVEGNYFIAQKGERLGLMNLQGEWLVPPVYDELQLKANAFIAYREHSNPIYMEISGKPLLKRVYEEVSFFSEGMAYVRKDGLCAFVDTTEQWKTDLAYQDAQPFSEGLAAVEKNDRWGFINAQGQIKIPLVYDYVYSFENARAMVQFKGKWGVINPNGKIIIPFIHDELQPYHHGTYKARFKHLWGLINEQNEWLIEPQFSDIKPYGCNYWLGITPDKKEFLLNSQGKIVHLLIDKVW